jgi:hypothetical protein
MTPPNQAGEESAAIERGGDTFGQQFQSDWIDRENGHKLRGRLSPRLRTLVSGLSCSIEAERRSED